MRPASRFTLVATIALGLVLSGTAAADVKSADQQLLKGDYQGAIKAYKAIKKGKEFTDAQLGLGKALLRTGDYTGAEAAAKTAAKDKKAAVDAKILLAEVYRATGKYDDAKKALEALVAKNPKHYRARAQLALAYRETGVKDKADELWNGIVEQWNEEPEDDQEIPDHLYHAALAVWYLESYQESNSTFADATEREPMLTEAWIEWGWLFLAKYAIGEAEINFDKVLEYDASNPDAHVGKARVIIEQSYDVQTILDHVDKALVSNPNHVGAMILRATIEIDNAEYDAAKKTLETALKVNPNSVEARAHLAAIAFLKDDTKTFDAEKEKVFKVNPLYARFYHVVADFAVKEHRYKEAIELEQKAIEVDETYYPALAEIGNGYLRMGDDTKGLEYLNKAFELDGFNVIAYNVLDLFEETIAKQYTLFDFGKNFRFRMPNAEKPLLERYAPRTMQAAWDDMVKRYGFTPTKTTVEMFADPTNYSVRTVGLPNLGALGVCFGQVITALSPANENVNWSMVLWHELGHVFAIQLSNSRVPRWFTEGLSEYETIIARPEWRRENDADVWMALEAGTLPSVIDLNTRFLRAKDMNEVVVAYHMSSITIEYIATTYGFPKIVEALKLFGKGKETGEVITAITGREIKDFDKDFQDWLRTGRLKPYAGTFKINVGDYMDLPALEAKVTADPKSADAQASVAIGYLIADDVTKAKTAIAAALKIEPKNKKALYADAQLVLQQGDSKAAIGKLEALIKAGGDGYETRLQLAQLYQEQGDDKSFEDHLQKSKKLDPEKSQPYYMLWQTMDAAGRKDEAMLELEKYAYIENMEYAPTKLLLDYYFEKKDWKKVKEFGEMALNINPYEYLLHVELGTGYLNLAQNDDALYEFQSALLTTQEKPVAAHLGMARVYIAKKDTKKAKKSVDEALKLEPKNAEALELKATLNGKKTKTTKPKTTKPKAK